MTEFFNLRSFIYVCLFPPIDSLSKLYKRNEVTPQSHHSGLLEGSILEEKNMKLLHVILAFSAVLVACWAVPIQENLKEDKIRGDREDR